jgi:MoxR-like ATPase
MDDMKVVWERTQERVEALKREIGRVIVGQHEVIEQMLVALLCKGHCLIVGVPGLAKTLLVSTLGRMLGLTFRRIQFTPDLMPTDIIGSEILQEDPDTGKRSFQFMPGPVFANLILADEINRTPPKTQAALLEAMQERQVTVAGRTMTLEEPFIVFATQNPIEHEGTYPLPEAQLDRFFFCLNIGYPGMDEERTIVRQTTARSAPSAGQVLSAGDLKELQDAVLDVPVPDHVLDHILMLSHATRPASPHADDYMKKYVAWGAGPRASQTFTRAAKALAVLRGNPAASIEEVHAVALPVLRHRIIPNYNATGDGLGAEDIVRHLLEHAGQPQPA